MADSVTKAEILQAIREQAERNGGDPLGRRRFEELTGITESDWSGRYWANWSGAVREAGYAPMEMNPAIPREVLLDHLANLAVELESFPTSREVQMARRTDPEFPSRNTFAKFGRKADLARALLTHCENREGLDDVAGYCREVLAVEAEDPPGEAEIADGATTAGSVYLIRSGRYFKIGRTNSVGRRQYELSIQLAEPVELVHEIQTDDVVGIERYWHDRFADQRTNGEWFSLTRADVRAFKRRKRFM